MSPRIDPIKLETRQLRDHERLAFLFQSCNDPHCWGDVEEAALLEEALKLAHNIGHYGEQAQALYLSGRHHIRISQFDEAVDELKAALLLFEDAGDNPGQINCLLELGSDENRCMRYEEALSLCDKARALLLKSKSNNKQALILWLQGRIKMNQNAFQQALKDFEAALKLALKFNDKNEIAHILMYMTSCCQYLHTFDKAADCAAQAMELFNESGDRIGKAELLRYMAVTLYLKGQYSEALKPAMESLELKKKTGDKLGEARSSIIIGIIYYDLGDLSKALEYPLRALKLNETIDDRKVNLVALQNMAVIYNAKQDFEKALDCYRQTLEEYIRTDDKREISWSHYCMGNVFYNQLKYNEAFEEYVKAYDIAESLGDDQRTAMAIASLSDTYYELKDYENALKYKYRAIELQEAIGDKRQLGRTYIKLAYVFEKLNRWPEAKELLSKGLALATETDHKDTLRTNLADIVSMYRTHGEFEQALTYFEQLHDLDQTLLGEQTRKQLTLLNFEHDTERKEKEAELNLRLLRQKEELNRKLEEKNDALEKLNREKNSILGIVAHDLKNPLASVRSFAEVSANPRTSAEKREQYLRNIALASDRMFELVKNLLDVNFIESGKIKLYKSHVSLNDLITEYLGQVDALAQSRGILLIPDLPNNTIEIETDKARLLQIIENYVSNALKYCAAGTRVFVSVKNGESYHEISVLDEGPGIAADEQAALFDAYSVSSNKPRDGESKTGLGLAIVKKIADSLGADTGFHSEKGKGSEFYIRFPKAEALPAIKSKKRRDKVLR